MHKPRAPTDIGQPADAFELRRRRFNHKDDMQVARLDVGQKVGCGTNAAGVEERGYLPLCHNLLPGRFQDGVSKQLFSVALAEWNDRVRHYALPENSVPGFERLLCPLATSGSIAKSAILLLRRPCKSPKHLALRPPQPFQIAPRPRYHAAAFGIACLSASRWGLHQARPHLIRWLVAFQHQRPAGPVCSLKH